MDLNEDFFSDLTIVSGGNEVIEETKVYKDAEGRLYNVAPENVEAFLREHVNAQEAGLAYDPQGVDVDQSYTQLVDQVEKVAFDPLNQDLSGTFLEGLTVIEDTPMQDLVESGFQEKPNKYQQILEETKLVTEQKRKDAEAEDQVKVEGFEELTVPDVSDYKYDPLEEYKQANLISRNKIEESIKEIDVVDILELDKLSENENKAIANQFNVKENIIEIAKEGFIDYDNIGNYKPGDHFNMDIFSEYYQSGKWDQHNPFKYPNNIGDKNGAVRYSQDEMFFNADSKANKYLNHEAPLYLTEHIHTIKNRLINEYTQNGDKILYGNTSLTGGKGYVTMGQIETEAREIMNQNRSDHINMYVSDNFRLLNQAKEDYLAAVNTYGPSSPEALKANKIYSKLHRQIMDLDMGADQMFNLGTGEASKKRGKIIDDKANTIRENTDFDIAEDRANFLMYKLYALHEVMRNTDFGSQMYKGANVYNLLTEGIDVLGEKIEMPTQKDFVGTKDYITGGGSVNWSFTEDMKRIMNSKGEAGKILPEMLSFLPEFDENPAAKYYNEVLSDFLAYTKAVDYNYDPASLERTGWLDHFAKGLMEVFVDERTLTGKLEGGDRIAKDYVHSLKTLGIPLTTDEEERVEDRVVDLVMGGLPEFGVMIGTMAILKKPVATLGKNLSALFGGETLAGGFGVIEAEAAGVAISESSSVSWAAETFASAATEVVAGLGADMVIGGLGGHEMGWQMYAGLGLVNPSTKRLLNKVLSPLMMGEAKNMISLKNAYQNSPSFRAIVNNTVSATSGVAAITGVELFDAAYLDGSLGISKEEFAQITDWKKLATLWSQLFICGAYSSRNEFLAGGRKFATDIANHVMGLPSVPGVKEASLRMNIKSERLSEDEVGDAYKKRRQELLNDPKYKDQQDKRGPFIDTELSQKLDQLDSDFRTILADKDLKATQKLMREQNGTNSAYNRKVRGAQEFGKNHDEQIEATGEFIPTPEQMEFLANCPQSILDLTITGDVRSTEAMQKAEILRQWKKYAENRIEVIEQLGFKKNSPLRNEVLNIFNEIGKLEAKIKAIKGDKKTGALEKKKLIKEVEEQLEILDAEFESKSKENKEILETRRQEDLQIARAKQKELFPDSEFNTYDKTTDYDKAVEDFYIKKLGQEKGMEKANEAKGTEGFFVDADSGYVFIDLQRAREINNITIGTHEVLHHLTNKTLKDPAVLNRLVEEFKKELSWDELQAVEKKFKKQVRVDKKGKVVETPAEEWFNAFNDAIRDGDILPTKENARMWKKLGISWVNNIFKKSGAPNATFKTGKAVYDFIKDYATKEVDKKVEIAEPKSTVEDSQIPVEKETFQIEREVGEEPVEVEIVTNKDGSRTMKITTGEKGGLQMKKSERISKDNTLTNKDYIDNAVGEVKGEGVKIEGTENLVSKKILERIEGKGKEKVVEEVIEETDLTEKAEIPVTEIGKKGEEEVVVDTKTEVEVPEAQLSKTEIKESSKKQAARNKEIIAKIEELKSTGDAELGNRIKELEAELPKLKGDEKAKRIKLLDRMKEGLKNPEGNIQEIKDLKNELSESNKGLLYDWAYGEKGAFKEYLATDLEKREFKSALESFYADIINSYVPSKGEFGQYVLGKLQGGKGKPGYPYQALGNLLKKAGIDVTKKTRSLDDPDLNLRDKGGEDMSTTMDTKSVEIKSKMKEKAPDFVDQKLEDAIETTVLEIEAGVKPDVADKNFVSFIQEVLESKLTPLIKDKFGKAEDYDNFMSDFVDVLKETMPAKFFVKLESQIKPKDRQFTTPPKRLTKQADIDKAVRNDQAYVENTAQGVNMYILKNFTNKQLYDFIMPPAIHPVTGKKSGRKGTIKTSVAKSTAVELGKDMMPSVFKNKVSDAELAKIMAKMQRDPKASFSRTATKAIKENPGELTLNDLVRSDKKIGPEHRDFIEEIEGVFKDFQIKQIAEDFGISTKEAKELGDIKAKQWEKYFKDKGWKYIKPKDRLNPENVQKHIDLANDFTNALEAKLGGLDNPALKNIKKAYITSIGFGNAITPFLRTGSKGEIKPSVLANYMFQTKGEKPINSWEANKRFLGREDTGYEKLTPKQKKLINGIKFKDSNGIEQTTGLEYVYQPTWDQVGFKGKSLALTERLNYLDSAHPNRLSREQWVEAQRELLTHPELIDDPQGYEKTMEANKAITKLAYEALFDVYNKAKDKTKALEDIGMFMQQQTNAGSGLFKGFIPMETITMKPEAKKPGGKVVTHNEHMTDLLSANQKVLDLMKKYKGKPEAFGKALDLELKQFKQGSISKLEQSLKDAPDKDGAGVMSSSDIYLNTFTEGRSMRDQVFLGGKNKGKTVQEVLIEKYGSKALIKRLKAIPEGKRNAEVVELLQRLENKKNFDNVFDYNEVGLSKFSRTRKPKNIKAQLDAMSITDRALALGRKLNKEPKKIRVFDFDDTLARTKSNVLYEMPDGKKGKLTAEEFAKNSEKLEAQGAKFDFKEFSEVKHGKKGPLFEVAKMIKESKGKRDMFVLTARPPESAKAIHDFLKKIGLDIPLENIVGLGNGAPAAKAEWMVEKASEGYNDFYFADDHTANVKAVKEVLDQLDVKSKVQQAKFSKTIDKEFNQILEEKSGIESFKEYSRSKGKVVGAKKGKYKFILPPGAEDFTGLIYPTLGKGKKGEAHLEWYNDKLIKPYNRATRDLSADKVQLMNDFKGLKKQLDMPKDLREITESGYTKEQAARVYLWDKMGEKVPNLTKTDLAELLDIVNSDGKLKAFADQILEATKGDGYSTPGKEWLSGTMTTDLIDVLNVNKRKKYLEEWQENIDVIYSEKNLNKLEAIYGPKYREALENSILRMKTGKNRTSTGNKASDRLLDYINGAQGTIMFLNMRSAILQSISAANFVNLSFNNPIKAGRAFVNQKQYWKDFMSIMNSDYLVGRRQGLKLNISESEISDAAAGSTNKAKAVINYILEKGYAPTKFMDSFAIASGGATWYRNKIKDLMKKEGLSEAEAQKQAFEEFMEISEKSQQSSDPSKISAQQSSDMGRVFLQFVNTPMQYARIQKRALQDLANKRGDWKSNVSKILYYGVVQNLWFNAMQQGLFALGFGDEEINEKEEKKIIDTANGMADSILRGTGFAGMTISVLKNTVIDLYRRSQKQRPDYKDAWVKLLEFSPAVKSKFGKLKSAAYPFDTKEGRKEIKEKGFSLDNPAYESGAKVISATTNIPLDRLFLKYNNLKAMLREDTETWKDIALFLGWPEWQLEEGGTVVEDKIRNIKNTTNKEEQRELLLKLGYSKRDIRGFKKEEDRAKAIAERQ